MLVYTYIHIIIIIIIIILRRWYTCCDLRRYIVLNPNCNHSNLIFFTKLGTFKGAMLKILNKKIVPQSVSVCYLWYVGSHIEYALGFPPPAHKRLETMQVHFGSTLSETVSFRCLQTLHVPEPTTALRYCELPSGSKKFYSFPQACCRFKRI